MNKINIIFKWDKLFNKVICSRNYFENSFIWKKKQKLNFNIVLFSVCKFIIIRKNVFVGLK